MAKINLSLDEKLGQLFMIGFTGHEIPTDVKSFMAENNIGFTILFTRNILSPFQTATLTNDIHSQGDLCPAIFTDQEGGLVVRFGELGATVISHMGLAATEKTVNARKAGQILGRDMKAAGLDGVFAPVLDVNISAQNPVIGIRSFSDDPATVTRFALEFAGGLKDEGIAACGKHYPGHGAATADSHLEIPEIFLREDQFKPYCLQPFLDLAEKQIEAIMSAHIRYPALSDEIATFSPYFINVLLRQNAGYEGVIFTDCLEMDAIKKYYTPEKIVMGTMAAGIDVLSVSHNLELQRELLEIMKFKVTHGEISEMRIDESVNRILKLKNKLGLLNYRPKVSPEYAEMNMRNSLHLEETLAAESITLLRNHGGILPIQKGKKILILEWRKEISYSDFSGKGHLSDLSKIAEQQFPFVDCRILKTGAKIPKELKDKIHAYDHVIACPFSLTPGGAAGQAESINEILQLRKDLVVAALGNPYDIQHFPDVGCYIVTYGARQVQLKALIEVIAGHINPRGKLPVDIQGLFSRGTGMEYKV